MKMTMQSWCKSMVVGVLIFILLLGGVSWTQAAPVLFGTAFNGPGGAASLYSIDPASGVATLVGPVGFNQIGAIDFDASGVLFGVGRRPGDGAQVLLTIDTTTGSGTEVGPLGVRDFTQDISFRNADGTLFSYTGGNIFTIDTTSGAATLVGNTGSFRSGNGLAFSASDTLYNANESDLRTVDQTTGAVTFVTNMNYPNPPLVPSSRANGMDFDSSTGIVWASVVDGSNITNYLATIDITNGNVTVIGQTVRGLDALAVQVQAVPEPNSPALLLVGGLPMAWMLLRRRKLGSNLP